ncbi:MAG: hypothetical protein DRH76_11405 [Deltaproteobacteria bacterium]|nr:MAG: hypothetical protein DRH76_11405 [Deltaproteobacteria bacterium]
MTDAAAAEVCRLLAVEGRTNEGLRLAVSGGGCSGLVYKVEFDTEQEGDIVVPFDGFNVLMDRKSTIYLRGIVLDHQQGLSGRGFQFNNPNASNTCGGGEKARDLGETLLVPGPADDRQSGFPGPGTPYSRYLSHDCLSGWRNDGRSCPAAIIPGGQCRRARERAPRSGPVAFQRGARRPGRGHAGRRLAPGCHQRRGIRSSGGDPGPVGQVSRSHRYFPPPGGGGPG